MVDASYRGHILSSMKACWVVIIILGTFGSAWGNSAWVPGPYLMLDETLIKAQAGVRREVNHPSRLAEPVVTGYEDGCFQPYVTVLRDPQTKRFRMWYGIPAKPQDPSNTHLAYIESEDGIHWLRPHRVLETPPIQFGTSIIDEGPAFADPAKRFKFAWWKDGGLQVAYSADGLEWHSLAPGPVLRTEHDVTAIARDPLRQRYMALVSMYPNSRRTPNESISTDLIHWKTPWPIITADPKAGIEKGETQFYGMNGVIVRGNLLVSMVKVLRDDLNCEPGKTAKELHDAQRPFAGLGYTVLAWSHDGETWKRDTEPFLDRNPQPGTWDRAMTWGDCQLLVGDYTYIYYGGYRWGHKAERFTERQLGFAHMPRDRYVGFSAGQAKGSIQTRVGTLQATSLTLNAAVDPLDGELRVRVVDARGKACAGFDWDDGLAMKGDRVAHPLTWKATFASLQGKEVAFEFILKHGQLYAFDLNR